ncbi:MAG: ATP-binding protein [Desulfobacterales bacterium]
MKENYYKNMRKNIFLSMLLVPIIPFVLSLWTGYSYFTRSLEESTMAAMKRIVEDHRQMIGSFLAERTHDLEFIVNDYSFEQISAPQVLRTVFLNLQARTEAFADLGIFDENGNHVAYHGPYELKSKVYRDEEWFKKVMRQGYYISDIFLGYRKIPHFIIAVAKNENGRKWVIRATIDTPVFTNLVEKIRVGKSGEAYLLNAEGLLQTTKRSSGKKLMERPDDRIQYPEDGEIRIFIDKNPAGEKYLYATTWLKDKEWVLVFRQEKAEAFGALSSAASRVTFIFLVGLALIIGVAHYMTERIIVHMQKTDKEKEELGQHLIRAQRLAELGEMAAGFAHEINNPLQIIRSEQALIDMNFSELREKGELKPSDILAEMEDSMSQIRLQIERCAGITQAILKFGRQSEPRLQDVDLREFIPQIAAMISKKASVNGISITQDISDRIPPVHGDPGQLQQVILNFFNNAIDAIIERHGPSGGILHIRVEPDTINREIQIQIKDNGAGISPENLKKIFSPFFTTKPVGKGTGLGLAVCFGIIDNMGGKIDVESEKGKGTAFTIHLPASAM